MRFGARTASTTGQMLQYSQKFRGFACNHRQRLCLQAVEIGERRWFGLTRVSGHEAQRAEPPLPDCAGPTLWDVPTLLLTLMALSSGVVSDTCRWDRTL